MTDTVQITYANSTFTRLSEGKARGAYGWSSPKWRCDVCSREGYGDNFIPATWAESCARGHLPCPWCGKQIAVVMAGTARVHTGCKARPAEVQTEWDTAKETLVTVRSTVAESDWHTTNFEGHSPTAHLIDTDRWSPACTCGCIRPDEDGVLVHARYSAALDQAAEILAGRVHGPKAGQEAHA